MSSIRDQQIAAIDFQIQQAAALRQGTVDAQGQLQVTPDQLRQNLLNDNYILDLELEKAKLADPVVGTAPPPPSLTKSEKKDLSGPERANIVASHAITRTANMLRRSGMAIKTWGARTNRHLAALPTPGDVWTPIILLLFTFLVLIPVNGFSRMQWLWMVLLSDAYISMASVGAENLNPSTPAPTPIPTQPGGTGGPQPNITITPLDLSGSNGFTYLSLLNLSGE